MRKIKEVRRKYKSRLVLCRKDPFQYIRVYISLLIYNIISTKNDQNSNNSKEKSNYKNVIYIYVGYITIQKSKEIFFYLILVGPTVASSCVNSGSWSYDCFCLK